MSLKVTKEKIVEVFAKYRSRFQFSPRRGPIEKNFCDWDGGEAAGHVSFMCDEGIKFAQDGRTEKAMRWLGFLQGFLWARSLYTIAQLGEHNMSPSETPDAA